MSQGFAEGAIGYVNYSYALGVEFPVAKVLNAAGYYTEPTPENVAVALLQAKINTDESNPATYLTQDLSGVYTNTDPRNYELSSYSYFILPTKVGGQFNEAKGRTLAEFTYYAMCQAQQQSASLGYSPLPVNLVTASFDQIAKIPGAEVQNINVAAVQQPDVLAERREPARRERAATQECDKQGASQCATGTGGQKAVETPVAPAASGGRRLRRDAGRRLRNAGGGATGGGNDWRCGDGWRCDRRSATGGAATGGATTGGATTDGAATGGATTAMERVPSTGARGLRSRHRDLRAGGPGRRAVAWPCGRRAGRRASSRRRSTRIRLGSKQTLMLVVALFTLGSGVHPGIRVAQDVASARAAQSAPAPAARRAGPGVGVSARRARSKLDPRAAGDRVRVLGDRRVGVRRRRLARQPGHRHVAPRSPTRR